MFQFDIIKKLKKVYLIIILSGFLLQFRFLLYRPYAGEFLSQHPWSGLDFGHSPGRVLIVGDLPGLLGRGFRLFSFR